jgi:hypothetical protein
MNGILAIILLPLAAAIAACDGETTDAGDHEEQPEFMELTVGGAVTLFDSEGDIVEGNPITIGVGESESVTARFLADDQDVISLDDEEFELRATNTTASIAAYTGTVAFSGTLNGVSAGTGIINFELFHLIEGHADWGPRMIQVNVE